jgi:hypothetical protein
MHILSHSMNNLTTKPTECPYCQKAIEDYACYNNYDNHTFYFTEEIQSDVFYFLLRVGYYQVGKSKEGYYCLIINEEVSTIRDRIAIAPFSAVDSFKLLQKYRKLILFS